MATRNVFVTVGTTKFDKLIVTVTSTPFLDILAKKGCRKLVLQVGQGRRVTETELRGITIECFSMKPSIAEEIKEADLVISHAGAGSCLGALSANKYLIAVINEDLMDNHQEELADKLAEDRHLFKSTCSNLPKVLEKSDFKTLRRFGAGSGKACTKRIDAVMGFSR